MLQQHDGLGVADASVGDHGQRLVEGQFQHLDVLALVRMAALMGLGEPRDIPIDTVARDLCARGLHEGEHRWQARVLT